MNSSLFQHSPGWYKLIMAVFVVFACFTVTSLLAIGLAIPLFGVNPGDIFVSDGGPSHVAALKFIQILQATGTFIIPAIILAFLFSDKEGDFLLARRKVSPAILVMVSLAIVAAIPLINATAHLNAGLKLPVWLKQIEEMMLSMEQRAEQLMLLFLKGETLSDYFVNMLMIAVLPAIGEELLFRGVFQRIISTMTGSRHWGIWITAFAFSFFHLQFFGFLPRFLLGAYFGYLLVWSGSIWVPVLAHFVNNGLAVTWYHFWQSGNKTGAIDTLGTRSGDGLYLVGSLLLLSAFSYMVFKYKGADGNPSKGD